MSNTDLAFITNEEQQNLKARFRVLIKDAKFFNFLVNNVKDKREADW